VVVVGDHHFFGKLLDQQILSLCLISPVALIYYRVKNGENILTKEISEEDANLIEERVALQQKQVRREFRPF
jgi:hypothetical protein